MKKLFKNPLFYINILLLILLILLVASINPNSTKFPAFVKKAMAAVNSILGQGTANYVAAFTGVNQIGNSIIYDNGTNVGIGTTNPGAKLDVGGYVTAPNYWIQEAGRWASQLGGSTGPTLYRNNSFCDPVENAGQPTFNSYCFTRHCTASIWYACTGGCYLTQGRQQCSNTPIGTVLTR